MLRMQLFKEAGTMEALESYDSMSVLPLLRAGLAGFVPMTLLREMVSQQAVLTIPVAQMPRSLQEVCVVECAPLCDGNRPAIIFTQNSAGCQSSPKATLKPQCDSVTHKKTTKSR